MMFFLSDEMPFSFDEFLLFGAASGGKAIEDTATGNPLVFLTDLAAPLKSLSIPFTPIQQGTGDPSPQNIRPIVPWNGLKVYHSGADTSDPIETSISFPSPVYGGTLDAVTGVLTVEWMGITLDGSSDEYWSVAIQTSGLYRAVFSSTSFIGGKPKSYSRLFANYFKNTTAVEVGSAWIGSTSNMLCFIPEDITTLAQWRSYLSENNLQLVYELDEPQTIQLTTAQITALAGNNTLWSDADGAMTAVYLKKT